MRPKSAPLSVQGVQRVTVSSREEPYQASMTREDRQSIIHESAKRKLSAGDVATITLQKGDRGFGFSIRGGEGMPLFVLRIAEDGAAWTDGRLKVSLVWYDMCLNVHSALMKYTVKREFLVYCNMCLKVSSVWCDDI